MRLRPRWVLLCGAALAFAAACSAPEDDSSVDAGWAPGALDEYLGRIDAAAPEELEAPTGSALGREEVVATCMHEAGFDYQPVVEPVPQPPAPSEVEYGSLRYAETYGYGISTTTQVVDGWGLGEPATDDPNKAYRDSMSPAELAQYETALYGASDAAPDEYDVESAGCYGYAEIVVAGEGGVDAVPEAMLDEVERFRESVDLDPRVLELDAAWAACLADRGYPELTDPASASAWLLEEYFSLYGAGETSPGGGAASGELLADFTAKEIAQAVADVECQGEVRYAALRQEVDHELQRAFVEQHRADLEAWLAAVG